MCLKADQKKRKVTDREEKVVELPRRDGKRSRKGLLGVLAEVEVGGIKRLGHLVSGLADT